MNASAGALALESQPFGWLRSAPAPARRALLAASIGWLFDGFDVMIYSMVLTALLADFGISKTTGGVLGSLTLLASAGGGVLFGMIADRYGRRTGLISSVLTYSLFTAACGLAQTVWQLAVCRFVLGLGMGGAWTTGAALVSETWPDRHRGKAVGLMQSAWAVGYGSAAALAAIVLPRYGWRAMFFIGALPALAAVWMHRGLNESAMWTDARTHGRASLGLIFSPAYRRVTLALVALSFCTLYAYWAFNFWVPAYLTLPVEQRGVGLDTSEVAGLLVVMNVGGWLGYVLYGYVSDRIGRRRSFVAYLIVAAVLVFAYGRARSATVLLLLGPVVAFFSTGYLSGFGAIIAELYPTTVRAAAGGFIFNIGRIGSAAAPLLIASLAQRSGFGIAFATTSAALVLAALTWLWIPETKGRALQ
jgi:MFS family permease